jgi:hypothetical protein
VLSSVAPAPIDIQIRTTLLLLVLAYLSVEALLGN